jgi:hypothetical protein
MLSEEDGRNIRVRNIINPALSVGAKQGASIFPTPFF